MAGRRMPVNVAVALTALMSLGCGGGAGTAAGGGGGGAAAAGSGGAGAAPAGDPSVDLGGPQTLLPDGNALGLSYFPDEGTSILSLDPFRIMVADGLSRSSVVVTASTAADPLLNLTSATTVVRPGPSTDFDNGYAGISAVYRHTDGSYYGFYEGEDQQNTGTIPGTSIPGFYARIGIASSPDGLTWTRRGYVIESFVPKRAPDGVTVQYDQGTAEPGAVSSADGRWLYLYYTEHSRVSPTGGSRPVVICMARADLLSWPPAFPAAVGPVEGFTKYYLGSFSTDGIDGYDSPVVAPPTSTSNALEGHAAYSSSLRKFLMIYGVDAWGERSASPPLASISGLYAAFSDDGITWRTPKAPLVTDFGVAQPGLSVSWEGSVLWDAADDSQGWLVYGFSDDWPNPPHYMVGRRISFQTAR